MNYYTSQESFWSGEFGDAYSERNNSDQLQKSNDALFSKILSRTVHIESILEFGCNIGLNLKSLNRINNNFKLEGIEINPTAADIAKKMGFAEIHVHSILHDFALNSKFDLTFTKGVLIHIEPKSLKSVYEKLVEYSKKYVLICEYYNPTPVVVNYRGHEDKLFKRDFAGELIEQHNLNLVDYGFVYHRDNYFPQDDFTWFLFEK